MGVFERLIFESGSELFDKKSTEKLGADLKKFKKCSPTKIKSEYLDLLKKMGD